MLLYFGKKITFEQSSANYLILLHFAGRLIKSTVKKAFLLDVDLYWVFLRERFRLTLIA